MSDISQLPIAGCGGGGGGVRQLAPHITTPPGSGRGVGWGVALHPLSPPWPPSSEYQQTCTCFVERRKTKRKERQGAIFDVSAEVVGVITQIRRHQKRVGLFQYYLPFTTFNIDTVTPIYLKSIYQNNFVYQIYQQFQKMGNNTRGFVHM
jgi:hypothetical protein